ncbi:hypothetical protein JX265_010588 [Neoarthrinium moseri]|uniref:WD-like domain-containing protein n=1 Tax=Neoarthrinium moseri TaxID=1658444 RepID=A0A9P9WE29_9PEZI|nr:uncharacterized protein JN550_011123 [Neoarthrinium moseri]KAI1859111.1 hypothetical protein JX265_010588 [Neoarthrinium moseri]KAI1860968.1 hypothetical protein JN550_011123 [Neoarthrinium moseri]
MYTPSSTVLYLAAVAGVAHVSATPVASSQPGELRFLSAETLPNNKGTLTFYGAAPSASSPAAGEPLAPRACSTSDVTCDSDNVPDPAVCGGLIDILREGGSRAVPQSPLSICLTLDGANASRCCVTWSAPVPNLDQKYLVPAATKVFNECLPLGLSGLARNVDLVGVCAVQCLSNRPDPCR